MSRVLDLEIPNLATTLARVRCAMTAEYSAAGVDLDAFEPSNLLHPLSTQIGYLEQQLYVWAREKASQATPFGATGTNLDAWLSFFGIPVPAEQTATGTVTVTGRNNAVMAGDQRTGSTGAPAVPGDLPRSFLCSAREK
jgi:hypothetical protein